MKTGLTENDVWNCDVPPLADVRGNFPLDVKNIPTYLRDPLARMRQAADGNAELIVADLRKRREDGKHLPELTRNGLAEDADVYQLLLRGVANDPRFHGYRMISLDDRKSAKDQEPRLAHDVRRFENTVVQAEELGAQLSQSPEQRGTILALSPAVMNMFADFQRFRSKLGRVLSKPAAVVQMPSTQTPLYEAWSRHILNADAREFLRLFLEAGSNPVALHEKFDPTPERALRPLPGGKEFRVAPNQQSAFEAALKVMQATTWSDISLLIHGPLCTGKTTLLAGYAQLMKQLGFKPTYRNYDTTGRMQGYRGGHPECIDQVDRAGSARPHAVMTSNDPLEKTKKDATMNQSAIPAPKNYVEFNNRSFTVHFPEPAWVAPAEL